MMNSIIILKRLAQNISLFLALPFLYGLALRNIKRLPKVRKGLVIGVIFACIAVVGMLTPIELMPGMIVDGRIILVGLAGAYGGLDSGITAGVLVSAFRLVEGGAGALTGIIGILGGSLVGVAFWFKRKPTLIPYNNWTLVLLGLLLTAQAQLLALITLPPEVPRSVVQRVSIPGFIFYPIGTIVIGSLLNFTLNLNELQVRVLRQAALIEQVTEAIIATDLELKIISWNEAATKIYGWHEAEAIGQHIDTLLMTKWPNESQAEAQQKLANAGVWRGEVGQQHKAGHQLDVLVSVSWARDDAGNIVGGVTVNRDVTKRKKAEDQLQRALDEKTLLLQELNHRTKNNMQVIIALLNLQMGHVKDAHTLELLKENQRRIHSMALVHQKLYQTSDLSHINLHEYLQELVTWLIHGYRIMPAPVELVDNMDDVMVLIDTAIPCGLIVNE